MPYAAAPTGLRFEHGPVLGIGTPAPRVSWQVPEADADFTQTAYEIEVDGRSFPVSSAEQILVPWPADPLTSRQRATVRVRVQGGDDWSEWSEPAVVEAGLLDPADWTARFVGPQAADGRGESAPVLTGRSTLP
jgi:alpha-L-rhamnosidase